jgi:hypothetical protein
MCHARLSGLYSLLFNAKIQTKRRREFQRKYLQVVHGIQKPKGVDMKIGFKTELHHCGVHSFASNIGPLFSLPHLVTHRSAAE